MAHQDAKLFEIAKTMTDEQILVVAVELERRAQLFRSIADSHLKSLSKGLQKAAMSKVEIMFPLANSRLN